MQNQFNFLRASCKTPEIVKETRVFIDSFSNDNSIWFRDCLAVRMPRNSELCFHGKALVKCLKGSARVMGYKILSDNIPCYAPFCYPAVSISFDDSTEYATLDISEYEELVVKFIETSKDCCVLLFTALNDGLESLDNFGSFFKSDKRLFSSLGLYLEPESCPKFLFSSEWTNSINLDRTGRYLVYGAKSSGKSTIVKYIINSLLSGNVSDKVAVLDIDVGQPEFTPMGIISLCLIDYPVIGSCFTHQYKSNVYKSVFYGHVSPDADPILFMRQVKQMYKYYCEMKRIPLVVNTNGWIKSMGLDLLQQVIDIIQPTTIYQTKTRKNFNDSDIPIVTCSSGRSDTVEILPAGDIYPTKVTAKEIRTLSLQCYFAQVVSKNYKCVYDLRPLTSKIPKSVALDRIQVRVLNEEDLQKEDYLMVLNGSLVGLESEEGICKGLAVVKAILPPNDINKGLYYIVTPLTTKELGESKVSTMTKGTIGLTPEILFQDKKITKGPYGDLYHSESVIVNHSCTRSTKRGKPRKRLLIQ